jgi:uncharacterized RDD family membrane protein YckC
MALEPTGNNPAGAKEPQPTREIVLARWSTRFWAWLVDFIIVTVAFEVLFAIVYAPLAFLQGIDGSPAMPAVGAARFAVQSLMFFAYWTYFESSTGQSIGKKLLKIKTTDMAGNSISARHAAIESFGKAFLLPIDVLLGWIFTNEKRQRLLARAADTIVVKSVQARPAANIDFKSEAS